MPSAALLTSAWDEVDRTSYTTASVSPTANRWLVADIYSRDDAGSIAAPTITDAISGTGSWTIEHTKIASTNTHQVTRAYVFTGATPGSGTITFDYGAATHDGCAWIVYELSSDVDGTDPFVQSASAESSNTLISVTLAAFASGDNRPLICASHRANEASTPEAGYTEIGDVNGANPVIGFAAAYHGSATDTNPSYSWASTVSPNLAIASEIKAAAGGGAPAVWEMGWVT